MRVCLFAILSVAISLSCPAQARYTETQVIEYAKSIDVKTLDPSLPSQRLDDWLKSGPPHAQVRWSVADTCDLKPTFNGDYPLCAKVFISRAGEWGEFLVQIGTVDNGIEGPAKLYYGIGVREGRLVAEWINTGYSERLSDLPGLLDQPVVGTAVGKLYEEVATHHPVGVPTGPQMDVIQPFLSKRLAEQLRTAEACRQDALRQRDSAGHPVVPAWSRTNIFSGSGERALPTIVNLATKEAQSDGSYLVGVSLWHDPTPGHVHLVGITRDVYWDVTARVVREDGRFVVDDVRLFEGEAGKGPSHLLSETFVGCDGPHWVGRTTSRE